MVNVPIPPGASHLQVQYPAQTFVGEPTDLEVWEAAWTQPPQYPMGLLILTELQAKTSIPSAFFQGDPNDFEVGPDEFFEAAWGQHNQYPHELFASLPMFPESLEMPMLLVPRIGTRGDERGRQYSVQIVGNSAVRKTH